nr:hypothetical protein [Tanacetum cinerariifolium]
MTYVMSKNDKILKKPLSSQHIIKLDTPLGNLKFTNKGLKDPIFGMPIPAMMLNYNIKVLAKYLEYLAKPTVLAHSEEVVKSAETITARATCRGKGLLTKNVVKIAIEKTKGLGEGSGAILEVFDELAFKSSNKEAGTLPEVLDRSKDESSSSSSESKLAVEDISSDDEEVS